MRTRPVPHDAEAETRTYEAEATKFDLEALTSLVRMGQSVFTATFCYERIVFTNLYY